MGFVVGVAKFGVWLAVLFVAVMVGLVVWYAVRTRNGIPGAKDDASSNHTTPSAPAAGSHD